MADNRTKPGWPRPGLLLPLLVAVDTEARAPSPAAAGSPTERVIRAEARSFAF